MALHVALLVTLGLTLGWPATTRDGLSVGRVWASYLHLHALGSPTWASSFVALARTYRQERSGFLAASG